MTPGEFLLRVILGFVASVVLVTKCRDGRFYTAIALPIHADCAGVE